MARASSALIGMLLDLLLILLLYAALTLMGVSIRPIGILLAVTAVAASGVRSILKGSEHSIFALTASLVELMALMALFTMGISSGSIGGVSVSLSNAVSEILALSILIYMAFSMLDSAIGSS